MLNCFRIAGRQWTPERCEARRGAGRIDERAPLLGLRPAGCKPALLLQACFLAENTFGTALRSGGCWDGLGVGGAATVAEVEPDPNDRHGDGEAAPEVGPVFDRL